MLDPIPPAPSSTPGPTPGPLNAAQLASLTKTEEICRLALQDEYLSVLITPLAAGETPGADDITEAGIQALLAQCEQVRNYSGQAATATTAKGELSQEELDAEEDVMDIIRPFQARARQKFHTKAPARLKDYGIGESIDESRSSLEQYALNIGQLSLTDALPKITAAQRTALANALQAYKASQTAQTDGVKTAKSLRTSRNALLKATVAGRMQIQFAADAEWPATDPANYPTRTAFQLPANRPFVG